MSEMTKPSTENPTPPGTPADTDRWFAVMYDELRRLAMRELRRAPAAAPSPTTLVHELYANLAGRPNLDFPDRSRFMGYAGRAMRGLIVDIAREQGTLKRGAGIDFTHLTGGLREKDMSDVELSRLSDAINELATLEPALAEVVDLKFFCGFSFEEIAEMRELSTRTVRRQWEKARLMLFQEIGSPPDADPASI